MSELLAQIILIGFIVGSVLGGNFLLNRATEPDYGDATSSILIFLGIASYMGALMLAAALVLSVVKTPDELAEWRPAR